MKKSLLHFALLLLLGLFGSDALAQAVLWSVSPAGPTGRPISRATTFSMQDSGAIDPLGNLFIVGSQFSRDPAGADPGAAGLFLGKYAAADGQELWRFTTPGSGGVPVGDALVAVVTGPDGDAYVTGTVRDANGSHEYVARISGANGAVVWQVIGAIGDATPANSAGFDLALDGNGNLFVLGTQNDNATVIRMNAATGSVVWLVPPAFDAAPGHSPIALRVDPFGQVLGVTFVGGGHSSLVFKLDGATGQRTWGTALSYFIDAPGPGPQIRAFTIDGIGKPTIAGVDIAKFSNVDGSLIWRHPLAVTGIPSVAWGVAAAPNGDLFATGTTGSTSDQQFTVRLASASGNQLWGVALFANQSRSGQLGKSIAYDPRTGHVAVLGQGFFNDSVNYELAATTQNADTGAILTTGRFATTSNLEADLVIPNGGAMYALGRTAPTSGPAAPVAVKFSAPAQATPNVQLVSTPDPSNSGDPVTLTATVGGAVGTPTGSVTFRDAGSAIPGCSNILLSGGQASCVVSNFAVGNHPLDVRYAGDTNYAPGGSITDFQQVNAVRATPSVSLASSANPASFGQPVVFTASVSGNAGVPTGTVSFHDGVQDILGCVSVPLNAGSVQCGVNGFMPGSHAVSASYSGDAAYAAATSATVTETVVNPPPSPAPAWQSRLVTTPPVVADVQTSALREVGPRSGVDAAGNLFVAANTGTSSVPCIVVIKYGVADGQVAWRRDICGTGVFSRALAVDAHGDVVVTGASGSLLYLAKLSGTSGATIWEQASGVPGAGFSMGLDAAGNPRIVATLSNALTVYGFSAAGALQWQRPIAAPGPVLGFAVDAAGDSAVSETHTDAAGNFVAAITRIDSTGAVTWHVTGPPIALDHLAMDPSGNVIASGFDLVQAYAASSSTLMWSQRFGGITTSDAQGNIYGIGSLTTTPGANRDLVAYKVDHSGILLWSRFFTDAATTALEAGITLDGAGNPVATALSFDTAARVNQQLTIKLDPSDGHVISMASAADPSASVFPAAVHAIPGGVVTFGRLFNASNEVGLYAIAYTDAVAPPQPSVVNLSTRGDVGTGDDVLIAGFIIGGNTPKTVVINAAGPSLASAGIANPLVNPTMTLVRSSDGAIIATNDDWQAAANAAQVQASGFAPADPREPAILMTLPPGAYTAIVSGVGGTTGVAVVGVFEVDHPEVPLINISTRGQVLTGDNVMIGGFVIQGTTPQTVVVAGLGPALTQAGVPNALANPTLTLVRSSDQSVVATNDDWGSAPNAADIQASGFAPSDPRESAVMVTLPPGAYTAILSGVGGTTGVGIVAVYRP
ncbi:MAG TPA: Ig-like domain repeat protein [Usitatibacter sp.]|nr:Ig-like domain repeat protein [Usitatibacter sp.]